MLPVNPTVVKILSTLRQEGEAAYLVGGSVRDLLLDRPPREWDITTSARPEQVSQLFPKVVPTGIAYGTVTVLLDGETFEVTTFRADEHYVDGRHPSNVVFTKDLHQDLRRRDFTMNAIAYDPTEDKLIDDHNGQADIRRRLIRAVGDPLTRFKEDGLRPLRACRFAAQLDFTIEPATLAAINPTLPTFRLVAIERVHDELVKMLATPRPSIGLELMRETGLLNEVLPELLLGLGVSQPSEYHCHDVYHHNLAACDAAPADNLTVRLAALLHDVSKPVCKEGETFYRHDQVGAETVAAILKRLKFSNREIDAVANLVANHMFDYSAAWSDAAVRRFLRRIGGVDNVPNLFALRRADVAAMHSELGTAYLPELQARIDKIVAEENALHVKDLKISGEEIMRELKIPPGPRVGQVLSSLLEKVLDNPALNDRETLLKLLKSDA